MKKWFCFWLVPLMLCFIVHSAQGASSEMEILLKKLVDKGILTAGEAESVGKETKAAAQVQKAEIEKMVAQKKAGEKGAELPGWLKDLKFRGDLRLRYESKDLDSATHTRERARLRLRLGAETKITDTVSAGFGFATAMPSTSIDRPGGDGRSGNVTFQDTFAKKSIWLDYAWAKWTPIKEVSLIAGKFANPMWQPSDMLISTDINPEGAALKLDFNVADNFNLFFNGGVFVLDEREKAPDPLMYALQAGFKWNITKDLHIRLAPAYYTFTHLKGNNVLEWVSGSKQGTTNTTTGKDPNKQYVYGYNIFHVGGEFGYKKPFGLEAIPYVGIFGGYARNSDPSKDNIAYLVGFTVGSPSIRKLGDWSLEYTYRRMERDSWLDALPESSFYSGKTDVRGHRVKALVGLTKNVSFGFNYYNTQNITGKKDLERLYQADLIFRF